jgi:4-hydroxythreonine-4-phosphate dehydrogenase
LGITLGDPAGIGPEVIVRALARRDVRAACRPVVIGDRGSLEAAAARLKKRLALRTVDERTLLAGDSGRGASLAVDLLPVSELSARACRPARPSIEGGRATYRYIETATRLAQRGAIDAIVTAPINKAVVTRAGFPISGHTELLRELTGAREVRMMLAGDKLRVVLVTMHVALADVSRVLTVRDVTRTILIAAEHLHRYHGLARPRIAVAGLNPHAGDHGLFGDEEATRIAPAVRRACQAGARASGPYAADSLFFRAVAGEFDAVVAMYHDQGLIPLKLLHFHDGVNVTMGLPILRTSPDHGTAYDIAGRGTADPGSMTAAILLAARMARSRAKRPAARSRRTVRLAGDPRQSGQPGQPGRQAR